MADRQDEASKIDLQKFREELSETGKEFFDLAMSVPEEDLMSQDEILEEIARRRGGIVYSSRDVKDGDWPQGR